MLEGIRILDFTFYLPGPFATGRLARMGAEVVKVEPPGGDPARHAGEQKDGTGLLFLANNRGKKSIAIDLKTEAGQRLALRLAERCDVLVESFRPGVMDRLGLGYEAVSRVNPGIVYCSLTGFGQSGPLADLASHDLNYQSISGLLTLLAPAGKPVLPAVQLADLGGGLAASEQILAALIRRGRTGRGTHLDIAMLDEVLRLLETYGEVFRATGKRRGLELLSGGAVSYGVYETKDGRHMALAALEPKFWSRFCQAVGHPEWISHGLTPQSEENPVYRELCALFMQRTRDEWTKMGLELDCCLTPVLDVGERYRFSPLEGHLQKFGDPALSPPPSRPGQDADTLLRDWLGAGENEIRSWREEGALFSGS
jgi:alpha-methylacyl-CoA racemase